MMWTTCSRQPASISATAGWTAGDGSRAAADADRLLRAPRPPARRPPSRGLVQEPAPRRADLGDSRSRPRDLLLRVVPHRPLVPPHPAPAVVAGLAISPRRALPRDAGRPRGHG